MARTPLLAPTSGRQAGGSLHSEAACPKAQPSLLSPRLTLSPRAACSGFTARGAQGRERTRAGAPSSSPSLPRNRVSVAITPEAGQIPRSMETLLKGKQIDLKREEFTGLSNSKPNKPRTRLPTTPECLPGHRAAPFPLQRDWLAPGWDPRKITQDKWRSMWY